MKNFILNLALLCILFPSLSSCVDIEFPDFSGLGGGFGYGGGYGGGYNYGTYEASFYTDSITQADTSEIKIWSRIQYDSVLIIQSRKISYFEVNGNGSPVSEEILSAPETVNFRELPDSTIHWTGRYEWIYKYTVSIDSLKKDVDYTVCVSQTYQEKGVVRLMEQCFSVRLN